MSATAVCSQKLVCQCSPRRRRCLPHRHQQQQQLMWWELLMLKVLHQERTIAQLKEEL
jgi:hypothetical protein